MSFPQSYNDVQTWKYKDLIPAFGAKEGSYKTYQIKTKKEVEELFADEKFSSASQLQLVELYMPKEDAPEALKSTAAASAKVNSKQ